MADLITDQKVAIGIIEGLVFHPVIARVHVDGTAHLSPWLSGTRWTEISVYKFN